MVSLKELFTLLSTGEFSNLAVQRTEDNLIKESEYDKVLGHIHLGLIEIYKRFRFLEASLNLHVSTTNNKYYLHIDRVADTHNITSREYIERNEDTDDAINIIKITAIYDSDGKELILDNRRQTPVVLQTSPDSLKVTGLEANDVWEVIYQAYPPKVVLDDDFDLEDVWLEIPETVIEPLLYYVAYRVYKPTGGNDSTANASKSNEYQQQFELSCTKMETYGVNPENDDDNDKFTDGGWC